jgi:hypothetical protein
LNQRSRHCFALRVPMWLAIAGHILSPFILTASFRRLSSSSDQSCLTMWRALALPGIEVLFVVPGIAALSGAFSLKKQPF